MGWKKPEWDFLIYYGNGTVFEGKVGCELPSTVNVQLVLDIDSKRGPYLAEKGDYYLYAWDHDTAGKWIAADEGGYWQYITENPFRAAVLFGRTLDNDKWLEVQTRAHKDLAYYMSLWNGTEAEEAGTSPAPTTSPAPRET